MVYYPWCNARAEPPCRAIQLKNLIHNLASDLPQAWSQAWPQICLRLGPRLGLSLSIKVIRQSGATQLPNGGH